MFAYVYILQSVSSKHYYVGSALDARKRLKEHNHGLNKSTRNEGPWKIVLTQEYDSFKKAKQIEYRLKMMKRRDIIERIIKDQKIKIKI